MRKITKKEMNNTQYSSDRRRGGKTKEEKYAALRWRRYWNLKKNNYIVLSGKFALKVAMDLP